MSDSSQEVKCKASCMMYIDGPSKNCIFSRLPIYYNQMRESVSELAKKVNTMADVISKKEEKK
jgi:hypothetical protein